MNIKEIVEVIKQCRNNPDIINSESNIVEKLSKIIYLLFAHKDNTWSELLDDYFKYNKEILLKISNNEAFVKSFTLQYGNKLPELSNEVLDFYKDLILNIIKNNNMKSLTWLKSKLLFNYLEEYNRTLLSELDLESFFPEIIL